MTTDGPTCAHGVSLSTFCHELHLTSQPRDLWPSPTACPHGVELGTFCRELHDKESAS